MLNALVLFLFQGNANVYITRLQSTTSEFLLMKSHQNTQCTQTPYITYKHRWYEPAKALNAWKQISTKKKSYQKLKSPITKIIIININMQRKCVMKKTPTECKKKQFSTVLKWKEKRREWEKKKLCVSHVKDMVLVCWNKRTVHRYQREWAEKKVLFTFWMWRPRACTHFSKHRWASNGQYTERESKIKSEKKHPFCYLTQESHL